MANDVHAPTRSDRGFSLVEMLTVVLIIGIMAAVGFPAISRYVRNYKVRGATREVTGEMQTARSRAIMSNTNSGVSFLVVDADSYRLIQEDLTGDERYGVLKDLPSGVLFEATTADKSGRSLRFNRLGGFCNPAAGTPCAAAFAPACLTSEASRCGNGSAANYVAPDASGSLVVVVIEQSTQLRRAIRIAPGGRVAASDGWEKKL
jgi:prepilin-type N-terminal cleavage/methylation domain-containing protein